MRQRHCQHCYDEGFNAGHQKGYVDGRTSKESERASDGTGQAWQWVDITDELRALYGLPTSATKAFALVDGIEIKTVVDYE